jgi:4-amino-4-deoxy-L-arabinose transferase-like glycosyltransferase
MALNHPIWSVRVSDALLFTILCPFFAALGARLGSRAASPLLTRLASAVFGLLAVIYYFGPQVYYGYIYGTV